MKIVVIANPASSRGAAVNRRRGLIDALDGIRHSYSLVETRAPGIAVRTGVLAPGSAGALAREAALAGADVVAAAGGDGTVGEVANGLIGTDVPLAVLPMGTGNDFARTLGFGPDLAGAVRVLAHGQPARIDAGRIEGGGYFVNVAGCGFDAEVAIRINHGFRRLRGTAAYLAAVLQTLMRYRPAPVVLEIDGERREERVMLCAVANARMYGGGMRIAPEADLGDGLFDVVLVGAVSRSEFLRAFPRVFKGTHLSHPAVKVFRGSRVSVSSATPLAALADGEEIGVTPAGFEVVPGALTVLV